MKRAVIILTIVCTSFLLVYLLRDSFMLMAGNYLIVENPIEEADAIFLLGGGPFDRGSEAGKLYKAGYAEKIICTGGQVSNLLKSLNLQHTEAEVARINLFKNNAVPRRNIVALSEATSTREEADVILRYCLEQGFEKVIILSSKFHTRRVNNVFRSLLEDAGIQVLIRGAPSSLYDESLWWESETGLIMVNNEYVKLGYYFLKY